MTALWCRLVNRSTQRAWRAPLSVIPSPWTARRPHATGRRTGLGQHPGDRRARVRAQSKAIRVPRFCPTPQAITILSAYQRSNLSPYQRPGLSPYRRSTRSPHRHADLSPNQRPDPAP